MLELSQRQRYAHFYARFRKLEHWLRFDVRYRVRRLTEILEELDISTHQRRVLDVGFGSGALLKSLPRSCTVTGVDVSPSAVLAAKQDIEFQRFENSDFHLVREGHTSDLPTRPYDLILTSHCLEHVHDDHAMLSAMYERLAPGGFLVVFVPIEEPDYILFHYRSYSLQSISERVRLAGFELLRVEGSLYVNGHIWKWLTIPSRRGWPVAGTLVDALRVTSLGVLPYRLLRKADRVLFRLGFGARQALVIAQKPDSAAAAADTEDPEADERPQRVA